MTILQEQSESICIAFASLPLTLLLHLEMKAEGHEAYVTQAALCALAAGGEERITDAARLMSVLAKSVPMILRRLRSYGAWQSREGMDYMNRPFAMNVVKDDRPHDLLYTMVVTIRRRWWKLWMEANVVDVINY